jgi:FxsC-like protein
MTEGPYFFLSYAHLPPTDDATTVDDPVVTLFFNDLSAEIRALDPEAGWDVGAYDRAVPSGEDVRTAVARSLGRAQVLVPLYSPRYLGGVWPMAEHDSFRERLARLDGDTAGHIQPVLWVPLPPGETLPAGVDLNDLGGGLPDYAVNGLRMLRELTIYRKQYDAVVRRLAERIVHVVHTSPIAVSPGLSFTESNPAPTTARFVVAVVAPTADAEPEMRRPEAYGNRPADWHPFVDSRRQPVARQAANVAERLGLPTAITDVDGLLKAYAEIPAVLLIDPWILTVQDGRDHLEDTLRALADWATPMVVCDEQDPLYDERGRKLFEEAIAMLASVGSHRAPKDPRAAADLDKTMPLLVMQARRRFLRGRPRTADRRPRLSGPDSRRSGPQNPPTPGADDR